jgi:hypothetical protein
MTMGLLDFDDKYVPPYKPGDYTREGKKRHKETALTQEQRDKELNNLGNEEVKADFSDSPHLDY